MKRRADNWPDLLNNFVETRRRMPFQWGENDCCLFASDWVRACLGFDPASDVRGRYHTALGATRILNERGGVIGVIEAAAERYDWPEVQRAFAQRGDIIAAEAGAGITLGIVIGPLAVFPGKNGIQFASLKIEGARFWRI